jgi:predicted nuclease of restriction endonuclease-like RecB superfamily
MLPAELLQYTQHSGQAYPRFLKPERGLPWAERVLETLSAHRGKARGEFDEALLSLEGDSPDYRVVRGLAHLALAEATLEVQSSLAPETLRREAFALAAQRGYGEQEASAVLGELAHKYDLEAEALREALYADLPEREVLTALPDLTPAALLDRYQLAQAQGLLYYATELVIQAHRNTSGEYKKLFRFLKFYGLMYAVEGDLDTGYRIHVDGPASLFAQTRRYGVRMAAFLPALLHVTKWELEARLHLKGQETRYTLTSEAGLVSRYRRPPEFDSLLEKAFFKRWARLETPWVLEREVEIIDLKGTVFLPDFALRHPDGRTVYVEIVGFWHPDYLKRKFEKVRRAGLPNLILAVSKRLKVGEGDLEGLPGPVVFFKRKLDPGKVWEVAEGLGTGNSR